MRFHSLLLSVLLLSVSALTSAGTPAAEGPLPPLVITDRGELLLENDDFSYAPWSAEKNPGKVHIVQYFGATRGDSKLFQPFTDLLRETFGDGKYHVTTIINLDAALWGFAEAAFDMAGAPNLSGLGSVGGQTVAPTLLGGEHGVVG